MGVGTATAGGDKRKEFSIPGLVSCEDVLGLVKCRTVSSHHPLLGSRVSGEELKQERLWAGMFPGNWDIVLSSGLHTGRGTDSVWTAS